MQTWSRRPIDKAERALLQSPLLQSPLLQSLFLQSPSLQSPFQQCRSFGCLFA